MPTSVIRSAICVGLLVFSATASGFAVRTEGWKEDALLHDGRTIKVEREVGYTFQLFYSDGMFGSWPDKFRLKFEHPDTHATIKWQGEQYFNPVLLDIVDGVPYLIIHGRPTTDTQEAYGCPELPYIFLEYQEGRGAKWAAIPAEQAPAELQVANLSPEYPDFPRRQSPGDEERYWGKRGRASRDLSHDQIVAKINFREKQQRGYFQGKIPRTYEDWHYVSKEGYLTDRPWKDCRPPYKSPPPSKEYTAMSKLNDVAESNANTVDAIVVSTITTPEEITKEGYRKIAGTWTGIGYLSDKCDGIVKGIKQVRHYGDGGGWKLPEAKLILGNDGEVPVRMPAVVTCENGTIYLVSRNPSFSGIVVFRYLYSGEIVDATRINFPPSSGTLSFTQGGRLWEVLTDKNDMTIVVADYAYSSMANDGGTVKQKIIYSVQLPVGNLKK